MKEFLGRMSRFIWMAWLVGLLLFPLFAIGPLELNPPVCLATPVLADTGAGWYLVGPPVIIKNPFLKEGAEGYNYHGYHLDIVNGSASGGFSSNHWRCEKEPGGVGRFTGNLTWTPPSAYFKPGDKYLPHFMSTKKVACGWSVAVSAYVYVYKTVKAIGFDDGKYNTGQDYTMPAGKSGEKFAIQIDCYPSKVSGSCTYNYVYKESGGGTPEDQGVGTIPGVIDVPSGSGKPAVGMALRADTVKAAIGEMITVPIYLDNSTGLANLNFNLVYDSRMVAVGNTAKGNLVPAATSLAANARQAGLIRIGLAGGQDITGSGILIKIPFLPLKALGTAGGRTDLKIEITTTGSASGGKPAVRAIDGWIELGGPGGGGGTGTGGIPPGGGTGTGGAPGTGEAPGGSGGTKPASGIPGDFNGNGVLEAIDALQALKMSVGLIPENLICDVDGDGKVTSTDARLILMKVVGK
jgi:hypothetical protein